MMDIGMEEEGFTISKEDTMMDNGKMIACMDLESSIMIIMDS